MEKMRLAAGQFNQVTDERLAFIKQLGLQDLLLNTPKLPGETHWEFMDLLHLRTQIEDAGLRLASLENVPIQFYIKAMLGQLLADNCLQAKAFYNKRRQ